MQSRRLLGETVIATQTECAAIVIDGMNVSAYEIPTDLPESDGTLEWNSTTLVVAELFAGQTQGIGFGYADTATACLIADKLAGIVQGSDPLAIPSIYQRMCQSVRNLGRLGIAAMALSIVDIGLW